jgi:dTDP-glucose 4,6-dehydratase
MSERLLVTGGAGFIGANFVHEWLATHSDTLVVVLDALTYAGNRASLASLDGDPRLVFVHGDICTPGLAANLLRTHQLRTIVHFAAESHVDRSIHGPDAFVTTNVVGTHTLLRAAHAVWLVEGAVPGPHRFHHVSTDEVYGSLGPSDPAFTELSPYAPNSPYAATKAASDHLVRAYHHTYGLPVTTSNCSNNYGPYHFPEKLIALAIVNVLCGRPVPLYGDGQQVRDWLYVRDHARAIMQVLARGRLGEVYNIGARCERTNRDTVHLICRLIDAAFARNPAFASRFPDAPPSRGLSSASLITTVPDRPGHDRRYAIDPGRLERELSFVPDTPFESGLAATIDWFLTHDDWWRGVMDRSYGDWIAQQYGSTWADAG